MTAHDNGDAGISTFGYFAPRSRQYSLTDVTVERSVAHGNLGIAGKGLDSGSGIQLGGVLRGAVRSSEAYGNGAHNDAPDGPAGVMVVGLRRGDRRRTTTATTTARAPRRLRLRLRGRRAALGR